MSAPTNQPIDQLSPRDAANWAQPVERLTVSGTPDGADNLNVAGRHLAGPLKGFGQMWQKTYRIRLAGARATPAEVIQVWKANLPDLMPPESRFYPSLIGVKPGEVVLINATIPGLPGGLPISTGVLVLYADDEAFTVMTPQGHPLAGWNFFSAFEEDGVTVAQVLGMFRASDPIYEFGFRLMGGGKAEDQIWVHVLTALAARFDVSGEVSLEQQCLDPRLQWAYARNIWHNAGIRTVLNMPVRWVRGMRSRGQQTVSEIK